MKINKQEKNERNLLIAGFVFSFILLIWLSSGIATLIYNVANGKNAVDVARIDPSKIDYNALLSFLANIFLIIFPFIFNYGVIELDTNSIDRKIYKKYRAMGISALFFSSCLFY